MSAPARRTAPARRQRDAAGNLIPAAELRDRAQASAHRRELEAAAHERWQRGEVIPHLITLALDAAQLDGPEVDIACGAAEPAVDQWEAGTRYPTWEQLCALAELTGNDVRFFTREPGEIHPIGPTVVFACDRSKRKHNPVVEVPAPILRFDPAAVAATLGGYCAGCAGHPLPHTCEQTALFDVPGKAV